jgi:DegV family protein with EDD domain
MEYTNMSIRIVIDSGCDLLPEEAKARQVDIIPLKTYFGEEEYLDTITMSHEEFFQKLVETDVFPTTSQISPYDYREKFQEIVDGGDTVLCLTISSKLSGCYQSACLAAREFPDQVMVVDTANACIGERILAELAVSLRAEGKSLTEIAATLEEKKSQVRVIALLDTLEYLKKGGRISPAVAFAGSLLSIKPVISIVDGEVVLLGKARGSKAGNNLLSELISREGGFNCDMPHCLAYSGLNDSLLRKYMADNQHLYAGSIDDIRISSIGCAIGSHIGPGAIAAAFFIN